MLKKIYIHNFKCFVNFELEFNDINLLLGKNGSGKTTLFEVIHKLQRLICNKQEVDELFSPDNLPRADYIPAVTQKQKFELQIEGNGGLYSYAVELEHQSDRKLLRICNESLKWNQQPLYEFKIEVDKQGYLKGEGRLYNDAFTNEAGIPFPSDWSRSGLGNIYARYDNTKLIWFKQRMNQFFIVQINPFAMQSECRGEESHPNWDMSNYTAWFAYLNNGYRDGVFKLEKELLPDIFDGFKGFDMIPLAESKRLELKFVVAGKKVSYKLSEISAGQKALIALYTLICCLPERDYTLCIDEPENFLALPETQPWLNQFYQQCQVDKGQGILISHHPKLINYLAADNGIWFSQEEQIIRSQKITPDLSDSGLSIAELIGRGWIYDE